MSQLSRFYSEGKDLLPLTSKASFPARKNRDAERLSLPKRVSNKLKKHVGEPEIIRCLTMNSQINKDWPNFIIPTPSAFQGGSLLAKLVHTVSSDKKINIIFVQPQDLVHLREGNLNSCYVTYGATVSKDNNLVHGPFTEALLAHKVSHSLKEQNAKDRLYRSGITLLNDPTASNVCRCKYLTQIFLEKLNVKLPAYLKIETKDDLKASLASFLDSLSDTKDVVVKPTQGSKGDGIKFFEKNSIEQIENYVRQLFAQEQNVIIQERINPLVLLNRSGKRLDWNLRVISFGSNKPIVCNIRSDEYEKNAPVNKSLGSNTEVFNEELFIEYSQDKQNAKGQYQLIIKNIEDVLKTVDPHLRNSGLIGYDLIIKEDLSVVIIELNGDATGGIGTALEFLQDKPSSQQELATKIIAALHDNLKQAELTHKKTCPTNISVAMPLV